MEPGKHFLQDHLGWHANVDVEAEFGGSNIGSRAAGQKVYVDRDLAFAFGYLRQREYRPCEECFIPFVQDIRVQRPFPFPFEWSPSGL